MRSQIFKRLSRLIPNKTIVGKELGQFDHIVSRRAFLGSAGKLTALAALVGSGLPPSVWANTNPNYQVDEPDLQLTDAERSEVTAAYSMTLNGELMDEQLTLQNAAMFKQFDGRHAMINGIASTPYIQTMPDESVNVSSLIRGESELLGLDEHNNLVHMYRDPDSGHGFKQRVESLGLPNADIIEFFVLPHPDNGTIIDGWIVGHWSAWCIINDGSVFAYNRTLKINSNDSSQRQDSGWKIDGYFLLLVPHPALIKDIVYGDGLNQNPCVHFFQPPSKQHGPDAISNVFYFHDLNYVLANPEMSSMQRTTYNWKNKDTHFNTLNQLRLVSTDKETQQFTFINFVGQDASEHFYKSYVAQWDDPASLMQSGVWSFGEAKEEEEETYTNFWTMGQGTYKVYPAPCFQGQISAILCGKSISNHSKIVNSQITFPAPHSSTYSKVGLATLTGPNNTTSDLNPIVQTNHDGIQSLLFQDDAGNVFQRRQNCQRQEPSDILSPFVAIEPKGELDTWFEPEWQQLDKSCIGFVAPLLTGQDCEYLVAKLSSTTQAVEYHSTQVTKFSLTAQEETIMVPMSEAAIEANADKGQQQITDTYYHAEINVLNVYGCSVGSNQPIEIRSSKPVRLIDNSTGRGHSISRDTSAILYTNAAGRIVASIKATDFKSPSLFTRIYDTNNQLDNQKIQLSQSGADHSWHELNPDLDAHKRLANPSHTNAKSLEQAGLLSAKNATAANAKLLQTAGSRLTELSPTPAPNSSLIAQPDSQVINPLQHISYMFPNLSDTELTTLSGSWTLDLQNRSLSEGYSEEVGSFFHSIGHLFHHIVHSIEKGVKAVINGVARAVTKVALSIEDGFRITFQYVGGAVSFALDTIEHIAKAIVSVVTTLADAAISAVKTLIKYIKLLFDFKDILALSRSIESGLKNQISYVAQESYQWSQDIKIKFSNFEQNIETDIDKLCQRSLPNIEKSKPSVNNSCVHNFVLNKFTNAAQASGSTQVTQWNDSDELSTNSLNSLVESLVGDVLVEGIAVPEDMVESLFDVIVKGFDKSALDSVLQDQKTLLRNGCKITQETIEGLAQITQLGEAIAISAVNKKVPFLSWLLKLFGLELTWGNLTAFMVAFPLHTMYAFETGHSLKSVTFNTGSSTFESFVDSQGSAISPLTTGYIVTSQIAIILDCMSSFGGLSADEFGLAKSQVKILQGIFGLTKAIDTQNQTVVGYLSPVSSYILTVVALILSVKTFYPKQKSALALLSFLVKLTISIVISIENTQKSTASELTKIKTYLDALASMGDAILKAQGNKNEEMILEVGAVKELSLAVYIAKAFS
ncbi:hypothetical protein L4C34_05390 [Vibrio profundum]|uniref:hypothetical protein n=1 Tax=Vibrio profundum TaxID=2910247 RepID=UPI003D14B17B